MAVSPWDARNSLIPDVQSNLEGIKMVPHLGHFSALMSYFSDSSHSYVVGT